MNANPRWSVEAPHLSPSRWKTEWSSQDAADVLVEYTTGSRSGDHYRLHRVRTGSEIGAGAVAVAVRRDPKGASVLLVRQDRLAPEVRLWELPRGIADCDDASLVATATRELAEETGMEASAGRLLGMIYPDTGLLASKVGVVLIELGCEETPSPNDGESDAVAWFDLESLSRMVAAGHIRDGMSLSAILVLSVWAGYPLRF